MDRVLFGSKVKLRPKEIGDARLDYEWQMDPELAHLDACSVVKVPFHEYLADFATQLRSPNPARRFFAITTLADRYIGNCSYYNINEGRRETELGIMIGDREYWGKGYGQDAVDTLVKYIFLETDLMQIHLKSLDWNYRAHHCFERCGFTRCGFLYRDGYSFILMEMRREQWLKTNVAAAAHRNTVGQVNTER